MLAEYKTVLVTGGAGFIGRHLADALLSFGKNVRILDNFSTANGAAIPSRATLVRADIWSPEGVAKAVQGVDLVFHAAADANGTRSVEDPRSNFWVNAGGTLNLLEASYEAAVKRFVYLSSASVYGVPKRVPLDERHPRRPFIPYGSSKLRGELYCLDFLKTYGLPVVIGRPTCVYGLGENLKTSLVEVSRYLAWHLNQRPIQVVGDAERKTRDFVHVSDVVSSLLLIADKGNVGEIFNLGSGEEVSMRKLIEAIENITGRNAVVREISHITDDTYRFVADIRKIRRLGYAPKVSLNDGIAELADQMGSHPELPRGMTIFKKGQRAEN